MLPLVGTYAQEQTDSLQQVAERITILSRKHEINKDDFTGNAVCSPKKITWVDVCPLRLRFPVSKGKSIGLLHFTVYYWGSDWCFWNKVTFLIDGKQYKMVPDEKPSREVLSSGNVMEYYTFSILQTENEIAATIDAIKEDYYNYQLLLALYKTESDVKIRFEGDERIRDRTIKASKLKTFKETFEYYLLLRGNK